MFVICVGGAAVAGVLPIQALLLPFLILWLMVFTLGLAMLLGSVGARFRDTAAVLPLILQAGIFVSPVGYSLDGAPKNIHILLSLNPISGLIESWRWALLDIPHPQWDVVAIAGGWTVVLAFVGWRIFSRLEPNFADYV
jgi:lipopolysaccharide transport system permease protein